ncbi:GntR family transcriptional regulator [Gimesia panareensis]|uniref:HTH-type transcriptional repressor YtrA n=1 Tax=Gimesia panareensis TaxID=2527978 RepID=A0A518AFC0_9PLAN|nr:GntR family transcriptional regulator [Gimesia panareensis]QDT30356.1 HTH-type transcriptional repressor YtrA [Gimesia panareensis]QDU53418.1 HTH-type transcriptional repressor YtrA [Gimesia panareensis]QDV21303.1 HTH-type transcriptional repressor YtrA [Gimesia panareensis]
MQIQLSEADGTPYYQQVVNQVKFLVASGRLQPHDQLPSVRGLAQQLTITPNTVARAYRELEAEGVVISRRGSGVYISDGVSPLSSKEKRRILNERMDALLTESRQLGVDEQTLLKLLHERSQKFDAHTLEVEP